MHVESTLLINATGNYIYIYNMYFKPLVFKQLSSQKGKLDFLLLFFFFFFFVPIILYPRYA